VPSAFLFLAVALTGRELLTQGSRAASPFLFQSLAAIGLCWAMLLGLRTFTRQTDWRDQRAFLESTIAAGGNSPRMLMNLANVEFSDGHQETALALYREALRRAPEQAIIWFSYASVLARTRDIPAAREALGHAENSPLLAAECMQLKSVLDGVELGRDPGDSLREAIARAPENWEMRKRYFKYLDERGQTPEALHELHDFIEQHPFRAESWRMLATFLEELRQPAIAAEAWREAALRDVRDADSRAALQRLAGAK
jgi:tetratricopeptide (TPR) repeat protein